MSGEEQDPTSALLEALLHAAEAADRAGVTVLLQQLRQVGFAEDELVVAEGFVAEGQLDSVLQWAGEHLFSGSPFGDDVDVDLDGAFLDLEDTGFRDPEEIPPAADDLLADLAMLDEAPAIEVVEDDVALGGASHADDEDAESSNPAPPRPHVLSGRFNIVPRHAPGDEVQEAAEEAAHEAAEEAEEAAEEAQEAAEEAAEEAQEAQEAQEAAEEAQEAAEEAQEAAEEAEEAAEAAQEAAEEAEEVAEAAEEAAEEAEEAAEAAEEAAEEAEEAAEAAQEAAEEAEEAAEEAAEAAQEAAEEAEEAEEAAGEAQEAAEEAEEAEEAAGEAQEAAEAAEEAAEEAEEAEAAQDAPEDLEEGEAVESEDVSHQAEDDIFGVDEDEAEVPSDAPSGEIDKSTMDALLEALGRAADPDEVATLDPNRQTRPNIGGADSRFQLNPSAGFDFGFDDDDFEVPGAPASSGAEIMPASKNDAARTRPGPEEGDLAASAPRDRDITPAKPLPALDPEDMFFALAADSEMSEAKVQTSPAARTNPFAVDAPTGVAHSPLSASVVGPAESQIVTNLNAILLEARRLRATGELDAALDITKKVLSRGENEDAEALREQLEAELVPKRIARIGELGGTPRLKLKSSEIARLDLDHRAGYVISQVDGMMTFEDLLELSSMSRFETLTVICDLLDHGVIEPA